MPVCRYISSNYCLSSILYILLHINLVLILVTLIAILILVERKLLALSQRRIGPILLGRRGILQIVADVIKPLFKEIFEQKFQAVTLISFGIFLLLFSQLVYMSLFQFGLGFSFLDGAELVILLQLFFGGLSCLSVLFIGFMSGTKYGLIGAVRLVIAEISSETMISLANLIIYINVCSFDYESIMYNQACVSNITIFGIIFAVAHLIQLFLTASRAPLDLIENEGELVAGYNTEFSGPDVLVIYFAEYLHIFNGTLQFIFLLFGCCFVAYFDSNLFICTYDFLY